MWRELHYVVSDSIRTYLPKEGWLSALAIIYRRLIWRVKRELNCRYLTLFHNGKKPAATSLSFNVHVTDHCNMNCFGCGHFAPLAKPWFLNIDTFARDIARIAELFDGDGKPDMEDLCLYGGEPLLHPDLEKFFPVARSTFPRTHLRIMTNGVLLLQKSSAFWQACHDNDVEVQLTVYPHMRKLFDDALKRGSEFGVVVSAFDGLKKEKFSWHLPLDLRGSQSPEWNFPRCDMGGGGCLHLVEGRMYTCCIPHFVHYFNEYFGKNLPVVDDDSIDIYKAQNGT